MAEPQVLDVSRFIDERRMSRFNAKVVVFCFFIILLDGYDIGAVAYAGPALVKAWGIANMKALGAAFSAGLVGILFGAPLFGWIGDRYGRKPAITGSLLTIGVFTLAIVWAGSLDTLIVLRFLTGIGIGGMLPTTIALTGESAPKRFRATLIIVMFSGITLGGALPGPVAAWLVPGQGWQVLFLIGGVLPIVLAVAAFLWLPESVKFLALRPARRAELVRILTAMNPELALGPQTRIVAADEAAYAAFRPSQLFADGMRLITPLLWVLFICNLMSFYFVNSWLPTVLPTANIPVAHAAWATALFQVGGTVGGLALSRLIDTRGFAPIPVLFAVGLVVVPLIGYATTSEALMFAVVFVAGFALFGLQFGINAMSALIYPTAIRTNGSGWAFGVGRFGSISGPLIGGLLISWQLTIDRMFLFLALPLAIGLVASLVLARAYARKVRVADLAHT